MKPMSEPPADTIERAATALRAEARRAAGSGQCVHLDPDLVRLLSDALDATAAEMRDTAHVREAELCDDLGDWRPVVISGTGMRHHAWTALLAAARAQLREAGDG